jgi:hypothetical protein
MNNIKYETVLPSGELLQVIGGCFKPRLRLHSGLVVYLSVALKYVYNKNKGFIQVEERSDAQCINLSKEWANRVLIEKGELK